MVKKNTKSKKEGDNDEVPITPNQVVLLSVYMAMAVNELACCCVLDIEPSIKDKDKETKKIYFAAKKRVMKYQREINDVTMTTGSIYADFNDTFDCYIQPILTRYRDGLYNYLSEIKGVENPHFCALVELARAVTKMSITEISNRIIECQKIDKDALSLQHYKLKDLSDVLNNLTKWVFRKADDINYNDSEECVKAYSELIDTLNNPNILGECIINAQKIADNEGKN